MNCVKCGQLLDNGAGFCGNCGQAVRTAPQIQTSPAPNNTVPSSPIAQVLNNQPASPAAVPQPVQATPMTVGAASTTNVPSYALANPGQHAGETKALLSLILGILGIVGVLIMAISGLILGIAGLVLATLSRHSAKRKLSNLGIIFSCLAIVASFAGMALNYSRLSKENAVPKRSGVNSAAVLSTNADTPCYSFGLKDKLNITHDQAATCDVEAYDGTSLVASDTFYKVYANKNDTINGTNFGTIAKDALEKDVQTNLPGFSISNQQLTKFSGSPAYVISATDNKGLNVTEAAVLHKVEAGHNFFVLAYATSNGQPADLKDLEAQWQWK